MSTKNKTTQTAISVTAFINTYVDNEQKKQDSSSKIEGNTC